MAILTCVFVNLHTAKDVPKQMPKKPCFRSPLNSQRVKGFQILMKSA